MKFTSKHLNNKLNEFGYYSRVGFKPISNNMRNINHMPTIYYCDNCKGNFINEELKRNTIWGNVCNECFNKLKNK